MLISTPKVFFIVETLQTTALTIINNWRQNVVFTYLQEIFCPFEHFIADMAESERRRASDEHLRQYTPPNTAQYLNTHKENQP